MSYILTLVASKNGAVLSNDHTSHICNFLKTRHNPKWLEAGRAVDIALNNIVGRKNMDIIRDDFYSDGVDVFITPAQNRRKKLLIADMDSTIVVGETLDDLAEFAGIKDKIAAITARAMNGEIGFHDAIRERVGLLAGLSVDALNGTLEALKYNDGARELVAGMKKAGARCILISGGFTFFTKAVANDLGFDGHHGNTLGIENNVLTGAVIDPILDKDSKLSFLNQYAQEMGITADDIISVGDGANDIPMLTGAGLGVGYRPKPAVANVVNNVIHHGDLSALLYVQGIA